MANTNSDIATAQAAAQRDPSAAPKVPETSGLHYEIRGQVTVPAAPALNDTLTLIPAALLPVGAVYDPAESWVFFETDPGTALALDIGPVSRPNGLADTLLATVTGLGTGKLTFDRGNGLALGLSSRLKVSAQEAVLATVKVSTSVVATVMHFKIAFRVIA